MSPLAFFLLVLLVALPIAWVVGEATDTRWLRRTAGPLFALAACAVSIGATAIHVGFDSSIRYTGAVNEFVDMLIDTSENDGPQAVINKLRAFDRVSMQTYEGGAILRWEEHVDPTPDDNGG